MLSTPIFAGNEGGGGFFHLGTGKTLDAYEAEQQGIEYIDNIRDLEGYNEVVLPTLKKLYPLVPDFVDDLLTMESKTWKFVGIKMLPPEDPLSSEDVIVCGVQKKHEVKLYKPCFTDKFNTQAKGELLFHELIRGRFLSNYNVDAKNIRDISYQLIHHRGISREQIRGLLEYNNAYPRAFMDDNRSLVSADKYNSAARNLLPEFFKPFKSIDGLYAGTYSDGRLCALYLNRSKEYPHLSEIRIVLPADKYDINESFIDDLYYVKPIPIHADQVLRLGIEGSDYLQKLDIEIHRRGTMRANGRFLLNADGFHSFQIGFTFGEGRKFRKADGVYECSHLKKTKGRIK